MQPEEGKRKSNYQSSSDAFERFTISINPALYQELETRAKAEKRTKSYLIEESLRTYFSGASITSSDESTSHQAGSPDTSILDELQSNLLKEVSDMLIKQREESSSIFQNIQASIRKVSEVQESQQMQIDSLMQHPASSPGNISRPPAAKKADEIGELLQQIQSIDDIQPDRGYLPAEAGAILLHLLKNPDADKCHSPSALTKRAERGYRGWNLQPDEIGYKDENGKWHIRGSYLQHHLMQEPAQGTIINQSE